MSKDLWMACILMLVLLFAVFLYGCLRHDTKVPVPMTTYSAGEKPSGNLIVMLPGRRGSMKDFDKAGFIALANKEGLHCDIETVDLHEGYYYNRTMVERIRTDVVQPALKNGYQKIWFVGVSLGGFGALMYANKEDDTHIAGILAIAPYLGDRIVKEIARSGGIEKWQPQANSSSEQYEVDLWKWLKKGHGNIPLYLVYGNDDSMAESHRMLASLLPPDHTIAIPGNHNWETWTALWKMFLAEKVMS